MHILIEAENCIDAAGLLHLAEAQLVSLDPFHLLQLSLLSSDSLRTCPKRQKFSPETYSPLPLKAGGRLAPAAAVAAHFTAARLHSLSRSLLELDEVAEVEVLRKHSSHLELKRSGLAPSQHQHRRRLERLQHRC